MKYVYSSNEGGVTLTGLVITIVVMLILAGMVVIVSDDENIVGTTEEMINEYYDNKVEKADELDEMSTKLDKSITKLTPNQVELIRNRIKDGDLYTVDYEPETINSTVTVASEFNGELSSQTFTQEDTGAKGTNKMNWYVLSADVNQVNLVSSVSKKAISFKDAGGYDNCLYFLNQIAKSLFINENLGVTANKVHTFRLSDIKNATEQVNQSSNAIVTEGEEERVWDWNADVVGESSEDAYNSGAIGTKKATPEGKKYPQLYGTTTENLRINNEMYDEKIPSNYNPISGDLINSTSATSSSLTVNYTSFETTGENVTKQRLNNFGNSAILNELLSTNCWLATRSINSYSTHCVYNLRSINSGYINDSVLCNSKSESNEASNYFRIVVSIPITNINISNDGTVSLKHD